MGKYLLVALLIMPFSLLAQVKPEQALRILDEKYPQEKLHIFLDREEYVAGETAWFKAYLFSGYVKSFISSTVYIELYSSNGKMIKRLSLPMWEAIGSGSLQFPDSLQEGVYHIRAFTKWMHNFDPSFEYMNSIRIYNPRSTKKIAVKPVQWTAAAFPESGLLLAGEENKVSVRLSAKGSLPDSWTGKLVKTADPKKVILTFSFLTPEVGAFLFTPEPNSVYEVHITDDRGNVSAITLASNNSGVLLKAEQSGNAVYVDMIFKGLPEGGLNYKLVAHMQQHLVLSSVIRKKQEVVKTSIPVGKLMEGILHLTLFDPQGKPIAERLVFVEHRKSSDGSPVVVRNKVLLNADSSEYFNYAVAVTTAEIHNSRTRNILSDLWFSDLTLMPENSRLYFSGKDEDFLARDALLITEKWKRFEWDKVLNNQFPVIRDSAEGYISYRATAWRNKKAVSNESLTLMLRLADSSLQFLQVKTDMYGAFDLDNIVFYDSVKIFYQPAKGRGNDDVSLVFERKGSFAMPAPKHFAPTSFYLVDRNSSDTVSRVVGNAVQQMEKDKQTAGKYTELEEVKVSAEKKTKKEELNQELASPLFQTQNEVILDIMNDEPSIQSYRNIFDWLDGRVAGLNFRILNEGDPDTYLPGTSIVDPNLINQRAPMMRDQQVSLFIDENPSDLRGVLSLPTSEIAMVKVIKGYFVGATSGGAGGGAIAIYTRKPGLNKERRNSLPSGVMVGYSPVKTFANDTANTTSNLIFWSPLASPDPAGQIIFDLPTPPAGKGYYLTITGFTRDARPVYSQYRIPQ